MAFETFHSEISEHMCAGSGSDYIIHTCALGFMEKDCRIHTILWRRKLCPISPSSNQMDCCDDWHLQGCTSPRDSLIQGRLLQSYAASVHRKANTQQYPLNGAPLPTPNPSQTYIRTKVLSLTPAARSPQKHMVMQPFENPLPVAP